MAKVLWLTDDNFFADREWAMSVLKAIIAENVVVGNQVKLGVGEETENDTAPHIYNHGLVTIGEKSVIPDGISVGKNSVISGVTAAADYEDSQLASGKTLIKAGE
jgi:glucose-1-phosphate adenylyltransferase